MIRKSVETRDWMNTIEPRNVRAVMKRIVEDVTAIDTQVGQLYEEGVRKAHSSGVDRTVLFPRTFFVLWPILQYPGLCFFEVLKPLLTERTVFVQSFYDDKVDSVFLSILKPTLGVVFTP